MLLPVVTLIAVSVLLVAEAQQRPVLRKVMKPLASLGFLATWASTPGSGVAVVAVGAGLVFGALGDVLLLSSSKKVFVVGIGAFLLNHVAFCVAFVGAGVSMSTAVIAALPTAVIAVGVWRWLGPHAGALRPAVLSYVVVISVMVALAFGTGRPTWILGAVLFFTSDLCVARERFVRAAFLNKGLGLPLYYVAQLVFASGV